MAAEKLKAKKLLVATPLTSSLDPQPNHKDIR
jgi:hypothetical protein